MKVLSVGSGGREHAIAWRIAQSPRLSRLFVAPGNAGTDRRQWSVVSGQPSAISDKPSAISNIPIGAEDIAALVAFANDRQIDLVIVGPEAPLALGKRLCTRSC